VTLRAWAPPRTAAPTRLPWAVVSGRLLAVVALALVAGAAPAAQGRPHPALRLVTVSPLRVHGSGFGTRERVRVRVVGASGATRRVRAGRAGGFSVTFARIAVDPCSSFTVTAVGRSGRRATLRRRALAECPPA
jgi:hypothetical protein